MDTSTSEVLDRLDGICEEQLRFAIKAMLLTERISVDMVTKALDLGTYFRITS